MEIKDLEYKELRLDLVDLTEGVVGSFLFYYDEELKKIYELPPQKRGAELRKLANRIKEDYKTGRIATILLYALLNFTVVRGAGCFIAINRISI